MSATSPSLETPLERDHLLAMLHYWQRQVLSSHRTLLVSLSRELRGGDPWAIYQDWLERGQFCFYWDHPQTQETFVAQGVTRRLQMVAGDPFEQGQRFMEACLAEVVPLGVQDRRGAGPIFCGGFPFHSQPGGWPPSWTGGLLTLPQWQLYQQGDRGILTLNFPLTATTDLQGLAQLWQSQGELCQERRSALFPSVNSLPTVACSLIQDLPAQGFQDRVRAALDRIAAGDLEKVVLAATLDLDASEPISILASLAQLRRVYPGCYIFALSEGPHTHFLGASPERLLSLTGDRLRTDALAGSAPRGRTERQDRQLAQGLLTSGKEAREHQAVVNYLLGRLRSLGLLPQADTRQLLTLSNIQHLWTPITAPLDRPLSPLAILGKLHPTPAVAGLPADRACAYLREQEPFDRGLYAAPLGWVDAQGNGEFIVGIRSALITGQRIRLYAGAGIVAGSEPEQEYQEVQLKFQSLLQLLMPQP